MSIGTRGKATNAPREASSVQVQSERESMLGEMPGEVVSFDPVSQTISVKPLYRPQHSEGLLTMPTLQEIPVRFPRLGGFVITTPVNAGDKVTLRPQMRSTENYHSSGSHESNGDSRSFALSDMEAYIDGGEPLTDPIPQFNAQNLEIRSSDGGFKIEMSPDGGFKMKGSEGDIFDLMAQVVEHLASDGLDVKTGSSLGTNHALQHQTVYAELAAKLRGMTL